jgi:hypothetical protein
VNIFHRIPKETNLIILLKLQKDEHVRSVEWKKKVSSNQLTCLNYMYFLMICCRIFDGAKMFFFKISLKSVDVETTFHLNSARFFLNTNFYKKLTHELKILSTECKLSKIIRISKKKMWKNKENFPSTQQLRSHQKISWKFSFDQETSEKNIFFNF